LKILLLDNYDSFTYNLYHYLQQFCDDVTVLRNDAITAEETDAFTHIVLSPGPGLPKESGVLMDVIARQAGKKPILGICLGMQAIAEYFGANLFNQSEVKHGVTTRVLFNAREPFFAGLTSPTTVGLYHSWAVDGETLPAVLKVSATSTEGVIMALKHRQLPIFGVQFHPESILTPAGLQMIGNWFAPPKPPQNNDPLHGVKLADIVVYLEAKYGWKELGNRIKIRCFQVDPSVKSSLAFLRKTPWAREKVEQLYLRSKR
jgi:anthranilate synthase component 2